MTTLVEKAAQRIKTEQMYFPYGIGKTVINTSGIVQGTMELMATKLDEITAEQWQRYFRTYLKMQFGDERKGINLEQSAQVAFNSIGQKIESPEIIKPKGLRLRWKDEYHYPLIIAVALLWFVTANKSE